MIRHIVVAIVALLSTAQAGGIVACYFPNWAYSNSGDAKFTVSNINPKLCTHILYAFATISSKTYEIESTDSDFDITQGNFKKFTGLKSQNSKLKTLISVGGADDSSSKYKNMVSSSSNRKKFIDSAVDFLKKYGFDGVDMDWEFPSSKDKDHFTDLIKEMKSEFSSHGYLVTAAVSADSDTSKKAYDIPSLNKYIDFFNVMTYDYYGTWDTSSANYVAALYPDVDDSVKFWLKSGASAKKVVLGIPVYGPSWKLSSSNKVVPPAPADGIGPGAIDPGTMDYWEICLDVKKNGWTQVEDVNKEAYAYKDRYWTSYDTPAVAKNKGEYAKKQGLGGIMFWELSADDFHNKCGEGTSPVITQGRKGFCNSESGSC